MAITYHWRGDFESPAVSALHAEGFGGQGGDVDWPGLVAAARHARAGGCEWLHVDFTVTP